MALYQGKTVSLNKPMKGDVKKFKVFVKCDGKVKKVNFGDKNMTIKSHIKANKKSYCARSGGIKGASDRPHPGAVKKASFSVQKQHKSGKKKT